MKGRIDCDCDDEPADGRIESKRRSLLGVVTPARMDDDEVDMTRGK